MCDNESQHIMPLLPARWIKRASLALTGVLLCVITCAITAFSPVISAHAQTGSPSGLLRSDPAQGQILAVQPNTISLWFATPPDPRDVTIQLLNADGRPEQGCSAPQQDSVDPTHIFVTVTPDVVLPDGVYTIAWRVYSEQNSDVFSGLIPFAIGAGIDPAMIKPPQLDLLHANDSAVTGAMRLFGSFALTLGTALMLGAFLFVPYVLRPAVNIAVSAVPLNETATRPGFPALLMIRVGVIIGMVGTLIALAGFAADQIGVDDSFGTALDRVVTATTFGQIAWIRLALLLAIGGTAFLFPQVIKGRTGWQIGTLATLIIVITLALTGDAATLSQPFAPILFDSVRRIGETALTGLLIGLTAALWRLRRARDLSVPFRSHFAGALLGQVRAGLWIALGVTIWSGLYSSVALTTHLSNLIDTAFGLALLCQIVLIVMLAVWLWRFNTRIGAGIVIMVALLISISIADGVPAGVNAYGRGEVAYGEADGLRVVVALTPGVPGLNTIRATFSGNTSLLQNPDTVDFRFGMASHTMGVQQMRLVRQPDGTYYAADGFISMWGTWQLDLHVPTHARNVANAADTANSIDGLNYVMRYNPPFRLPGEVFRSTREATPLTLQIVLGSTLIVLGAAALIIARRFTRLTLGRTARRIAYAVAVSSLVFGIGTLVAIPSDPALMAESLRNPIPTTRESRQRGAKLYEQYCLACHGYTGVGDGTVGISLNPPPANLQLHMAAGHSDGELFIWTGKGIPGSAMPGFEDRMTETERWDVINCVRTFGQLAPVGN